MANSISGSQWVPMPVPSSNNRKILSQDLREILNVVALLRPILIDEMADSFHSPMGHKNFPCIVMFLKRDSFYPEFGEILSVFFKKTFHGFDTTNDS